MEQDTNDNSKPDGTSHTTIEYKWPYQNQSYTQCISGKYFQKIFNQLFVCVKGL